ncbi:MAG: HEAT repeat domain-containing protein [Planctomycetes bacterium]|nr:HEAT repeat domain-containing protein [Planctomycetota bacterium]
MPEFDLQLHFCDLCSQSIPQADIDTSRAVRIGDKWVCGACRALAPAGAGAPPPSSPSAVSPISEPTVRRADAGGSRAALVLSALALVGVVVVAVQTHGHVRTMRSEVARIDPAQADRVKRIQRQLDDIEGTLGRWFDDAWERSRAAAAAQSPAAAPPVEPEAQLELARELRTIAQQLELSSDESAAAMAELRRRCESLEERIAVATAWSGVPRPSATDANSAAELAPERKALLERLRQAEPVERARALIELSARADAADVPFVAALLRDPDAFVRVTAVRHLESARARTAVGVLIEALDDDDSTVRMAADSALRTLTGQRFLFDPWGRADIRAAGAAEWRAWWTNSWRAFLYEGDSGR